MLKLIYDLKVGFDDCYLTIKDEEWDLEDALEVFVESEEYEGIPEIVYIPEDEFYKEYCKNIEGLIEYLKDTGYLEAQYEDSVLSISKLYFSHKLGGTPIKHFVPVWEPSNWRLEYDPDTRSSIRYLNALSAHEVCDLLKLTKQQLHYYVKTEQIKKECNPENPKQFKYNRTDVYVLQKKLEKKYDRYKG
jgi:hypothetical protein